MRELTADDLRFTLHDLAPLPPGVKVVGSILTEEQMAKEYRQPLPPRPTSRPPVTWSHGGSPARKSPARERYCGGGTCQPGLNGRCTACHDDN